MSYFDATAAQLMVVTASPSWQSLTAPAAIGGNQDGGSPPTSDFMGADSSLAFNGSDIWVAYQDSTGIALLLAEQSMPGMPVSYAHTLDSGEGCGFYTDLLIDTSSQYVSNAVVAVSPTSSTYALHIFRVH